MKRNQNIKNEEILNKNRYSRLREGSIFLENQQRQHKLIKGETNPSTQPTLSNINKQAHNKGIASSVELG